MPSHNPPLSPQPIAPESVCLTILRGKRPIVAESQIQAISAYAWDQGVAPLLYKQIKEKQAETPLLHTLADRLRSRINLEITLEPPRKWELCRLLDAFSKRGINPLLMKGTPLAYSLYTNPALRPRCDTDLLIPIADKDRALDMLESDGYRFPDAISGKLISHQATCLKIEASGLQHQLDIHWQISNRAGLSKMLRYDRLKKDAIPLPELSPLAYTLSSVDALFLACIHRAGHATSGKENRLIWLYDIHLLYNKLTIEEARRFIDLAKHQAATEICLDALKQTQLRFHTAIDDAVLEKLKEGSGRPEPSSLYLKSATGPSLLSDLNTLPSLRDKFTLAWEGLFPPSEYMLRKYHTNKRYLLPILHLRRIIGGIRKQYR